jgi:hypothetical protein
MEALTKRVEKLEAYVKAHKERKEKKSKKESVKRVNYMMKHLFPNRPKLLTEEKKEAPKEAPKAEAPKAETSA